MKEIFASIIAAFVFVFGVSWLVQGNDFFLMKGFAPRYEQVRRNTFEQSVAYRSGNAQELQSMQFEYIKSTPEQQQALRSIILHRAAQCYDALPPDQKIFIDGLRNQSSFR